MFNRFLREHSNGGRPLSQNTLKNYKVVVNSWRNYQEHTKEELTIKDFFISSNKLNSRGEKIVELYRRFLIKNGNDGEPCTDNTIVRYLKVLKTFLKWVEQDTGHPMTRDFKIGREEVSIHTISLTSEEVERIEKVELKVGSKLHHVRNLMVLGIYTGLRHSEYHLVNPELWRESSQVITSPKTGKLCLVIHREPLRKVLREYEQSGFPSSLKNIQKINTQIKEVCKRCGLDREVIRVRTVDGVDSHERIPLYETVSTHVFRRTKITLDLNSGRTLRDICLETGQDEIIAKRHYDRPNLDELVKSLGISQIEKIPHLSVPVETD
jgi:integrase